MPSSQILIVMVAAIGLTIFAQRRGIGHLPEVVASPAKGRAMRQPCALA